MIALLPELIGDFIGSPDEAVRRGQQVVHTQSWQQRLNRLGGRTTVTCDGDPLDENAQFKLVKSVSGRGAHPFDLRFESV